MIDDGDGRKRSAAPLGFVRTAKDLTIGGRILGVVSARSDVGECCMSTWMSSWQRSKWFGADRDVGVLAGISFNAID